MRIAQIAPLAEGVPPKLYGGTERVVAQSSGYAPTATRTKMNLSNMDGTAKRA